VGYFEVRIDSIGTSGYPSLSIPESLVFAITHDTTRHDTTRHDTTHAVSWLTSRAFRNIGVGLCKKDYPKRKAQPGWRQSSYGWHGDDGRLVPVPLPTTTTILACCDEGPHSPTTCYSIRRPSRSGAHGRAVPSGGRATSWVAGSTTTPTTSSSHSTDSTWVRSLDVPAVISDEEGLSVYCGSPSHTYVQGWRSRRSRRPVRSTRRWA
jgi:hypothetical protein